VPRRCGYLRRRSAGPGRRAIARATWSLLCESATFVAAVRSSACSDMVTDWGGADLVPFLLYPLVYDLYPYVLSRRGRGGWRRPPSGLPASQSCGVRQWESEDGSGVNFIRARPLMQG
jgi:hypothetical protein